MPMGTRRGPYGRGALESERARVGAHHGRRALLPAASSPQPSARTLCTDSSSWVRGRQLHVWTGVAQIPAPPPILAIIQFRSSRSSWSVIRSEAKEEGGGSPGDTRSRFRACQRFGGGPPRMPTWVMGRELHVWTRRRERCGQRRRGTLNELIICSAGAADPSNGGAFQRCLRSRPRSRGQSFSACVAPGRHALHQHHKHGPHVS
jgi:hypothetical protein